jgi:hypothetical protein
MNVILEKYAFFTNARQYSCNSRFSVAVPSEYIFARSDEWILFTNESEATDEEILRYVMKSKSFAFLNDPAEDIYRLYDGDLI